MSPDAQNDAHEQLDPRGIGHPIDRNSLAPATGPI
jgi:hypothetical protein